MSVLVLVDDLERAVPLARWAQRLAQRLDCDLHVAWPGEELERELAVEGPALPELGKSTSAMSADAIRQIAGTAPHDQKWFCAPYESEEAAIALCNDSEIESVVAEVPRQRRREGPSLARRVFDGCPNRTILLRLGSSAGDCNEVLAPLLRGADNVAALRLAASLIGQEGRLTVLAVEPRAFTEAEGVGRRWIARQIDAAQVASDRVTPRVALSDVPEEAIQEAADGHDLIVFGASGLGAQSPNLRTPRSQLLGLIPERLGVRQKETTVAVVRDRWELSARLRLRLGRWLDIFVPQLDREHRVNLTERLQAGSEPNFDFLALMVLSTAIAALGLVQDSAAVVIGAMLVAPLMTPILGAGLSIVQGNLPLLRSSVRAILSGYALAFAVSYLVGLLASEGELTGQLLARARPNLLDLGVAFLSGVAAAYCLARPGLSAALPGVAIAAALVPPIATTGIAVALGRFEVATGALLLFATNVAAIIVGAFFSLFAGGLRGQPGSSGAKPWVRTALIAAFVAVTLLIWPLARTTVERSAPEVVPKAAQIATIERVVRATLIDGQSLRLVEFASSRDTERPAGAPADADGPGRAEDSLRVVLHLRAATAPVPDQLLEMANKLAKELSRRVHVQALTELVVEATSQSPAEDPTR